MTEINLLKYLNLNFAEIHQLEHEVADENENIDKTKKAGKKFPVFLLISIIGISILIGILIFIYFFIISPDEKTPEKSQKKQKQQKIELIENKKFKKIGSISFIDNKTANTNTNTNTNTNILKYTALLCSIPELVVSF